MLTILFSCISNTWASVLGMHYNGVFQHKTFTTNEGDTYSMGQVIGKGVFGVVYLGTFIGHSEGGAQRRNQEKNLQHNNIAIKKIRLAERSSTCLEMMNCAAIPQRMVESQRRNPFECEVLALKRLGRLVSDPVESFEGDKLYIALTLIPGKSLVTYLNSKPLPISVPLIKRLYNAAKISLERLHLQGISHNDCHTGNIMVHEAANETLDVNWIDFGKSRLTPSSKKSEISSCSIWPGSQDNMYEQDMIQFRTRFFQHIYDLTAELDSEDEGVGLNDTLDDDEDSDSDEI